MDLRFLMLFKCTKTFGFNTKTNDIFSNPIFIQVFRTTLKTMFFKYILLNLQVPDSLVKIIIVRNGHTHFLVKFTTHVLYTPV